MPAIRPLSVYCQPTRVCCALTVGLRWGLPLLVPQLATQKGSVILDASST